jgi:hypothetical protein
MIAALLAVILKLSTQVDHFAVDVSSNEKASLPDANGYADNVCGNEECSNEKGKVGSQFQNVCEDRK